MSTAKSGEEQLEREKARSGKIDGWVAASNPSSRPAELALEPGFRDQVLIASSSSVRAPKHISPDASIDKQTPLQV
jgi:hypothetical protein